MDGVSVARRLRECREQTPVLMLTARDAASDVVRGLDSGADDYLTKPFSIDVLLARLRAVSRRGAIARPACLEIADVTLDPASHRVTRGKTVLNLTPREYQLLELLMRNRGRAISRDTILDSVWGSGQRGDREYSGSLPAAAAHQNRFSRAEADPHRSRLRIHDAGAGMN